jgi:ubiquinone/menaquinone biosynthesis C-methylase UbiE
MSNPAETYERYMVPAFFGPWASRLLEWAAPGPGERVLDVASGTGVVARQAAPIVGRSGHVVGVDFSPHMLAVAREAARGDGLAIEWREGRAEALPFADGSFDLVLCQFALMFFADRSAAVAEMLRVLRPGGRAGLSVFQPLDRHPFYETLHEAILRRLGASGVEDIFSLGDAATLQALMAAAGFRRVEIEPVRMTARFPDPDAFLAGEIDVDTASVPSMQHLDPAARKALAAAIREEMEGPLREHVEDHHVVLPFHANFVRAERANAGTTAHPPASTADR